MRRRISFYGTTKTTTTQQQAQRSTTTSSADEAATTTTAGNNKKVALLAELDRCTSTTEAQRVLQNYFCGTASTSSSGTTTPTTGTTTAAPPLYQSVQIPPGASTRPISDGDLAIQTRLVNKKYAILDLIELSGQRDSDRASLAVLTTFLSTTVAAGTYKYVQVCYYTHTHSERRKHKSKNDGIHGLPLPFIPFLFVSFFCISLYFRRLITL
jgi:hypothetical protein